jgi:hypothetical protein
MSDKVTELPRKPTEAEKKYQDWLELAHKRLPAWFTMRMMMDNWHFGLLLTTGKTLLISQITNLHIAADNSIWIDVDMQSEEEAKTHYWGKSWNLIGSPTRRPNASINTAHIICAVELADT